MLCGTSTGGIIALGLGKGLTATEILEIYIEQGGEVFPAYSAIGKKVRQALGYVFNRCDTDSLYALIDEILGETKYWESNTRICIPSAETNYFEPFVFKTPHHKDYRLDYKQSMAFIAKTTSAAPGHFRPLNTGDGYEYIDGGIWANNPVMIGVADALACYDLQREQIKVLSLGCGAVRQEMTWLRRKFGGLATWATLILEAMEIQSHNVVGQARLICGGDRVLRLNPPLEEQIALWDWEKSRVELPTLGRNWATHLSGIISEQFLYGNASRLIPIYQD
jgi:patatin-like phospholipase/acyl hydrolase